MSTITQNDLLEQVNERKQLCQQIKTEIVERLSLNIEPAWIADNQPLFGRGLELDSIDTLEISIALQEVFDVMLTDDNMDVLGSVNKIADFITSQRNENL
ncbi:phosphopantetheine-binding protein [Priestia megaterium]|jgi:acyl carrier protein|uniref:Acyl carrier domain protein n=2 Tax=Bacillaceae TaxID=186817 RepID=D5E3L5_PRIM1|nr:MULTISPECIES: phosphopantetheine-binding protein [Bacillaceae]KOP63643.1 acyl carrier protein [Bacillus sp. FJAT-21351]MCJ7983244.1 phosphopantetheine-binding protein [Priestia sp. OVL9]ADE72390.1 acyl carrier domain protein [Priestia megaterium QM B1551]MBG9930642.1 acyl carrier protein [Priestia aryabhattai]MCT9853368.1 phosphopantetheine-binding protein [Priestia megaterium]